MKMKATHDLDNVEEGQALLPPSPCPSSVELPGSVERRAGFCVRNPQQCWPQPAEQVALTITGHPKLVAFCDRRLRLIQGLRDFWGGKGGGGGGNFH